LSHHRVLTKEQPLRNAKAKPHVGLSHLMLKKNGTGVVKKKDESRKQQEFMSKAFKSMRLA